MRGQCVADASRIASGIAFGIPSALGFINPTAIARRHKLTRSFTPNIR
jgi:hypothetical protein